MILESKISFKTMPPGVIQLERPVDYYRERMRRIKVIAENHRNDPDCSKERLINTIGEMVDCALSMENQLTGGQP